MFLPQPYVPASSLSGWLGTAFCFPLNSHSIRHPRRTRVPSGQFSNRPSRLPEHRSNRRSPHWQEKHWSKHTPDPCRIPPPVLADTPSDLRNRSQCRWT